jgi:FKBP-type peptidyl-prolyl cis-trans isomerase 2
MMKIAEGSRVTLTCRVLDAEGNVLDDGNRPMTFTWGKGEVIAGLEKALADREPGWSGEFDLAPEEAYGPHRPELVFEAVRENLPEGLELVPGMNLSPGGMGGRFPLKVLSLTERGALLDGNHPLAGKRLHFNVSVLHVESS